MLHYDARLSLFTGNQSFNILAMRNQNQNRHQKTKNQNTQMCLTKKRINKNGIDNPANNEPILTYPVMIFAKTNTANAKPATAGFNAISIPNNVATPLPP